LADVLCLNVNINLIVSGWKFLEIDYEKKRFYSRLDCTDKLLQNSPDPECYHSFEHFGTRGINISKVALSTKLKSINIGYTRVHNDEWRQKLRHCAALEDIRIHITGVPKLFLSDFPTSLQIIALDNVNIGYAPHIKFKLKELSLCSCFIGEEVIQNFHDVFEADNIYIRCGDGNTEIQIYTLFDNILKTKVKEITMEKFKYVTVDSSVFAGPKLVIKLNKFLDSNNIFPPAINFMLSRREDRLDWTGRFLEFRQLQIIWYHCFDFGKFFTLESRKEWIKYELYKLSS
jgi:hypothetical protein